MPASVRKRITAAKRIVVKVGSHTVTRRATALRGPGLNARACQLITKQLAALHAAGREIIVVSSGSVAAGALARGLDSIPHDIPTKQALAALGQGALFQMWERAFRRLHIPAAQVLLTHDDLANRRRYLNSRQTLYTLAKYKTIPVINENDTVAVHEIKYGDNDLLAAQVASLVEADLLIMLTTTDGLYTDDPADNRHAEHIPVLYTHDKAFTQFARGPGKNALSTGGMATKLEAAAQLARVGIPTVIARGRSTTSIADITAGKDVGTLVMPEESPLTSRKHWIVYTLKPRGDIYVDAGAAKALTQQGRSLLPSGVTRVDGRFERGEAVAIHRDGGREIARGLVAYNAADMRTLAGKQSADIESLLGYTYGDAVIHRNDLVVTQS